jgi:hypothetical protein
VLPPVLGSPPEPSMASPVMLGLLGPTFFSDLIVDALLPLGTRSRRHVEAGESRSGFSISSSGEMTISARRQLDGLSSSARIAGSGSLPSGDPISVFQITDPA